MGYIEQTEREIRDAYVFLRENNMTIPSETLQFMLDAALEKLKQVKDIDVMPYVSCTIEETLILLKYYEDKCFTKNSKGELVLINDTHIEKYNIYKKYLDEYLKSELEKYKNIKVVRTKGKSSI